MGGTWPWAPVAGSVAAAVTDTSDVAGVVSPALGTLWDGDGPQHGRLCPKSWVCWGDGAADCSHV